MQKEFALQCEVLRIGQEVSKLNNLIRRVEMIRYELSEHVEMVELLGSVKSYLCGLLKYSMSEAMRLRNEVGE